MQQKHKPIVVPLWILSECKGVIDLGAESWNDIALEDVEIYAEAEYCKKKQWAAVELLREFMRRDEEE